MILHRKRFFDDLGDKLIVMAVQLKYYQKDQQADLLARDAETFKVVLQEAESGQESHFNTPFHTFLKPEEF